MPDITVLVIAIVRFVPSIAMVLLLDEFVVNLNTGVAAPSVVAPKTTLAFASNVAVVTCPVTDTFPVAVLFTSTYTLVLAMWTMTLFVASNHVLKVSVP